jgi:hypothetical protein
LRAQLVIMVDGANGYGGAGFDDRHMRCGLTGGCTRAEAVEGGTRTFGIQR